MSEHEKVELAAKIIRRMAIKEYGPNAKHKPEQVVEYQVPDRAGRKLDEIMEVADKLQRGKAIN